MRSEEHSLPRCPQRGGGRTHRETMPSLRQTGGTLGQSRRDAECHYKHSDAHRWQGLGASPTSDTRLRLSHLLLQLVLAIASDLLWRRPRLTEGKEPARGHRAT